MTLAPVTVVVTSYQKVATLRACLDAVLRAEHPDKLVLVVDAGSTDGTCELLAQHYPQLEVVHLPGASLPTCLNHAVDRSPGRDLVRLHGDVAPQGTDWLQRLAVASTTAPRAGVVGVRLVHANGRIQSQGRDLLTGLGPWQPLADRRAHEFERDDQGQVQEVDGVKGACMYVRAAVLAQARFDPAYAPVGPDDDDFCLQVRALGHKVYVHADVRAIHFTPHRSPVTNLSIKEPTGRLGAILTAPDDCRLRFAEYFRAKWGLDPRSPDLQEVRARHGHTEVCWRIGARMRWQPPATAPAVDVCFVTWNSAHLLPRTLAALAQTRWPGPVRVFVVDNGSRDGTVALLQAAAPDHPFPLQVQSLPTNVGVAAALNIAFLMGSAPLVARLDDDTLVSPEWLERMVPRFAQRPYAGMIGPKVLHDCDGAFLQSNPGREWPEVVPVGDRVDRGQFDCLARVVSVRGCCNLYRRQVFADCGLLDVRYAPSQYDECDHHVALNVAGYEVLYDGSVAVRHLLVAGRSQTRSNQTNAHANSAKLLGKWGLDVWERLERGIDLSREGRFLPVDGDTSAFLATRSIPRGPVALPCPEPDPEVARRRHEREALFAPDSPLQAFAASALEQGEAGLQGGDLGPGAAVIMLLMDAMPQLPAVLAFRARRAAAEGELDVARRALVAATQLAPEDAGLAEALATLRPPTAPALPVPTAAEVVLLPPHGNGDAELLELVHGLAAAYRAAGRSAVVVEHLGHPIPGAREVHAFGLGGHVHLLDQVQACRLAAPAAPIHLHPWLYDPRPEHWAAHVLPAAFRQSQAPHELASVLAAAAGGRLMVDGTALRRRSKDEPGFVLEYQRHLLGLVDGLCLQDERELVWLRARFGALPPHRLAPWSLPTPASTGPVRGPRDFALIPGPLLPGHNQLLALHALREQACVVVGAAPDPTYAGLCRRAAGPRTRFLDAADADWPALLRACRAVVLPTLRDRFTVPLLQARQLQVPLVGTAGSIVGAAFGELHLPVDFCDPAGIAAAFAAAAALRPTPSPRPEPALHA